MNAFNFILLRNTCAISKGKENITLQMYIDINSREGIKCYHWQDTASYIGCSSWNLVHNSILKLNHQFCSNSVQTLKNFNPETESVSHPNSDQ